MRTTAQKFNRANNALQGFEIHSNFIDSETLLGIAHSDNFHNIHAKYCNEHMRAWRDFYRELDLKSKRYSAKNNKTRLRELYDQWVIKTIAYFGYQNFKLQTADFAELGKASFYVPAETNTHSVTIFICNDINAYEAFARGFALTDLEGNTLFEDNVVERWTLAEQLEKTIKKAGLCEALLFLPNKIYYFRSDSQLSGECLEIDLQAITRADGEDALILATHLVHADFFKYHSTRDEEDDKTINLTPSANLFKDNLERSRAITTELHQQMTLALELLVNERLKVDKKLSTKAQDKAYNKKITNKLFDDALNILYRILFILFAEAKKFLPIEDKQYASFYSLDHFIDWAENYLKKEKRGIADPEGTYLWNALQALFALMNKGIKLSSGQHVNAYNGELFADKEKFLFKKRICLRDKSMARVLIALAKVGGEANGQRWNFASLGVEQIGAVYEAMLSQQPSILCEEHVWVNAHGGGVGLVSCDFADKMQLEPCSILPPQTTKKRSRVKILEDFILRQRPAFNPQQGKFVLGTNATGQKQAATFYTPPKLASFIVEKTLQPLVKNKSYADILKVKIIEPAVGCGSFLIAAVRYMAKELLKAKQREQHLDLRGKSEPTHDDLQKCKRIICENCLHGVDVNPRSVNLAIVSLHLECIVKDNPLPSLDEQIKHGNSLLYANFDSDMLFELPTKHIKIDKKITEAYDDTCHAYGKAKTAAKHHQAFRQRMSKLKTERKQIGKDRWKQSSAKMRDKVNTVLAELKTNRQHTHYAKLKQLGDLWLALWFWPLHKYHLFPTHAQFQAICEHLLCGAGVLDNRLQEVLQISAKLARKHRFFHWQLEFPSIASKERGFTVLICNPPWQVVGVKEKDIYPSFDPQFMSAKDSQKAKRKQQLYNHMPTAACEYYHQAHFSSSLSQFWSKSNIAAVAPEGKLDLCVLFTLLSSNLTAKGSRNSLLLSKSAIYTNKATKNLRKYLFAEWGLEYGYSFINTLSIFSSIDSRNEFIILVGEKEKKCTPRFVNGISDLNSLNKSLASETVTLTMQEITRYFSKDNGSIPSLTSQRLKEIIITLQEARGDALYLDLLAEVFPTGQGLNITTSPQKGISEYAVNIHEHELSTAKWIPLYKGKYFDFLEIKEPDKFEQYLHSAKTPEKVNLDNITFVWRDIASSTNTRTMICSILPAGVWFDNSVWGIQFSNEHVLYRLATLWSTMAVDACVRLIGGVHVNMGYTSNIPIPRYDSVALQEAVHLYRKNFNSSKNAIKQARAAIEALVWLHYGGGKTPLDRDGLQWLMETQFPLVKKNEPDYMMMVLQAYDHYSKDKKYLRITGQAFKKKDDKKAD